MSDMILQKTEAHDHLGRIRLRLQRITYHNLVLVSRNFKELDEDSIKMLSPDNKQATLG